MYKRAGLCFQLSRHLPPPPTPNNMTISLSFVFVALSLISTTAAVTPNPGEELSARATACDPGEYFDGTFCAPCPAGNSCSGTQAPQPCQSGTYQPYEGCWWCINTESGYYQPKTGQTDSLPCDAGRYQPNEGQAFCYGAPSGRFQGMTGQAGVCGACCGWQTTPGKTNNNTVVIQCTGTTPFSGRASGTGCVKTRQGCDPVDTCAQADDGTCPDQTFY
ncbi:hypothetical protein DFH06DRAFT_1158698 [Mycena polygramma]|nr:hypothetical protein DFH06DRAFT_1158698 [Mycena polygramma]